ncbi:hypothetical protein E4U42_003564 [Claviceps africana]|uniref:EGF-like domain-containing protein n=1 Tax=Claviceps africana TaxID=83212 RepID=A0A8K0J6Z7_9HYPO|nr:hypothetical protein E4U42_003564 [Claviceps africana]
MKSTAACLAFAMALVANIPAANASGSINCSQPSAACHAASGDCKDATCHGKGAQIRCDCPTGYTDIIACDAECVIPKDLSDDSNLPDPGSAQ